MKSILTSLILSICIFESARADVKLPSIISDHMIVQRGMKVPIWGWADAGEKVSIKTGSQEQTTTADEKGKWRVALDPINAKDAFEITIAGKNSIVIKDVLAGEVWLCSGQSNMGFKLKEAANAKEATAAANHPQMRLFSVGRSLKEGPQDNQEGEWKLCTPESAAAFSAVAYFFGDELQQKMNAPVGLIDSSWGGTRAEAWIPKEVFDRLNLPYEPAWTQEWLHPTTKTATTQPQPPRPHEAPAILYDNMIAPFAGYAMRGVVWYQGETNTIYPDQYHDVLAGLITSWRQAWGEGDFPFLVVQLPNFNNTRDWAIFREVQANVAHDVPNTGIAVTIDLGDPHNIHPTNKLDVGKRLALVAQKMAYGQDVSYSGPVYKSMKVDGANVTVSFDHIDGGLVAKGGEVEGFELAGEDGKFVPANAKIEGEKVVASAEGVTSPKAVRYAWANNPKCSLYNKSDLPAMPFRSNQNIKSP